VHVANHRPAAAQNFADGGAQIRLTFSLTFDHRGLQAVGASDLAIIGNRHASFGTASDVGGAEVIRLTGANRSVSLVIKDEKLDRQLQVRDSGQFLDIELKAAVAVDADRFLAAAAQAHADAGGMPYPMAPRPAV